VACKVKGDMTIANAGGGGKNSITAFVISRCKLENQAASTCPKPGKVQASTEQLPWASRLAFNASKAVDEIVPGNPAVPDITLRCSGTGQETSSTGGFMPRVGENLLEFGGGQPFVGAEQLKGHKGIRVTAG
jgi:hypothetical protein